MVKMRISSADTIAGQPAIAIRELFKKAIKYGGGTLSDIASQLQVDQKTACEIFYTLCTEGYIEPLEITNNADDNDTYWQTTLKGNSLAIATARKPITRQTAERLLNEFLQRVKEINDCADYAYYVKKVVIFGSYLSDSPNLGDIDLAIWVEHRYNDIQERSRNFQQRIELALQNGRRFKTFWAEWCWPYTEVIRFLRNRSPSISIHNLKDEGILSTSIPSKILFDADAQIDGKTNE
jgi:predicted nucleotidyltransferase